MEVNLTKTTTMDNVPPPDLPLLPAESSTETASWSRGSFRASEIKIDSSHNVFNKDHLFEYVNVNLVREMIAQNPIEFLLICVIITYLIYYFSQISRRPRLIGSNRSKFVQFVERNLKETLHARFNPLIYFWGTNPQTALFGYLQGQTSTDEMPRSHFRRQYLYVSDAQYLTSNVDLSRHYARARQGRPHPVQLQVDESMQQVVTSLLDRNIRLALDEILCKEAASSSAVKAKAAVPVCPAQLSADEGARLAKIKELHLSSSSGSSSDSGVFVSHSSASSLTSSLSDVLIDTDEKCACRQRYQLSSKPFHGEPRALIMPLAGPAKPAPLAQEQLEFGQCALDWHRNSHRHYHRNKLVALISAGMTTGSDKKYVTDTVANLEQLGYEVCVFIRRGVGGLKLSSNKFFSPAKWRDFEAAVLGVREQRPGARLVAIGFSFGSIELCRYLSMSGKRSLIDAALLISCPFDPEAGGRNMRKRALNRRIDAYLAKNLGKQLHSAMFPSVDQQLQLQQQQQQQPGGERAALSNYNGSLVDLAKLPKIKSLVDFEDNYNRLLQNYPNSEAYAADSRLQDHLNLIETPTLCLSSEDDFMAPLRLLPLDQIKANKNLCMILTKRGGHMAFIDGLVWPKKPYFAQRIISKYMAAVRESLFADSQASQYLAEQTSSSPDESAHKSHCLLKMFDGK